MKCCGCVFFKIFQNKADIFGYGKREIIIELQRSPGKSTPRLHFVVKRISNSLFLNARMRSPNGSASCWFMTSFCVGKLSSSYMYFSLSSGKSVKLVKWTSAGFFAQVTVLENIRK